MANNNIFVLDDGTKEITVENKFHEEICKIHIRGGDISILDRYNDLVKDFDKMVAPLAEIKLKNDGTTSMDDDWKIVKSVEKQFIDRINTLFDMKDAGNLFKTRNAFSTIGGVFYVEHVLKMLGEIVGQEIEEESKKSQKRIAKYTKDVDTDDRSTAENA